jgi:hypothetical protein
MVKEYTIIENRQYKAQNISTAEDLYGEGNQD